MAIGSADSLGSSAAESAAGWTAPPPGASPPPSPCAPSSQPRPARYKRSHHRRSVVITDYICPSARKRGSMFVSRACPRRRARVERPVLRGYVDAEGARGGRAPIVRFARDRNGGSPWRRTSH
jgi:hypothetical protein